MLTAAKVVDQSEVREPQLLGPTELPVGWLAVPRTA